MTSSLSSWLEGLTQFADLHSEQLLSDLVSAASINPPGNEELVAVRLAAFLEGFGVACDWRYVEPGRPNLLAAVGPTDDAPSLALCSHLDVVPPGDSAAWSGDPFLPRRVEDHVYGRGACDAKGSLAAMTLALAFFAQQPQLLPGRLVLVAVAGEERGGTGSKHLVQSGFWTDSAIIGEPTNMLIALGHKGRIQVNIIVQGRAGHAANPNTAINPIDRLGAVLEAISALGRQVTERQDPLVGSASLVTTQVSSGSTNAATIPGEVVLTLDRRLVPSETHESAATEISDALAHLEDVQVQWRPGAYPAIQDRNHPLVWAAQASLEGRDPPFSSFPATCDQYIWIGAGIPSIILGPGDISSNRVHGADEFIALSDVIEATLVYARIAMLFLRASNADLRKSYGPSV